MRVVPFEPAHLRDMEIQAAQRCDFLASPEEVDQAGDAITCIIDGKPVMCAGRVAQWEGRWILWTVLSVDAANHMLALTRVAQRYVGECKGRLEAIVPSTFHEGHRWAAMVGLRFHHHEEMFLPDGADADIYVRFQ